MKKILDNSKQKTSYRNLFIFVSEHLNASGNYDGTALPDHPELPYTRGLKPFPFIQPIHRPNKSSENILPPFFRSSIIELRDKIEHWLLDPSPVNFKAVYDNMCELPLEFSCFSLADTLKKLEVRPQLLILIRTLLKEAKNREILHYVYMLAGVYGLKELRDTPVYNDLLKLAYCEEFTLYFCLACHLSNYHPQKDLWQLAKHTFGYGRVAVLNQLQFETAAEREWLLQESEELIQEDDGTIGLSELILRQAHIDEILPHVPSLYFKVLDLLNKYLKQKIEQFGENNYVYGRFEPLSGSLPLVKITETVLNNSCRFPLEPEHIIQIILLRDLLEQTQLEQNKTLIPPQEAAALMGACDKIIYSRDWEPLIQEELFSKASEGLNVTIAILAYGIGCDIWEKVFAYLTAHPDDFCSLDFCLKTYDQTHYYHGPDWDMCPMDLMMYDSESLPTHAPKFKVPQERRAVERLEKFINNNVLALLHNLLSTEDVLLFLLEHYDCAFDFLCLAVLDSHVVIRVAAAGLLSNFDASYRNSVQMKSAIAAASKMENTPELTELLNELAGPNNLEEGKELNDYENLLSDEAAERIVRAAFAEKLDDDFDDDDFNDQEPLSDEAAERLVRAVFAESLRKKHGDHKDSN